MKQQRAETLNDLLNFRLTEQRNRNPKLSVLRGSSKAEEGNVLEPKIGDELLILTKGKEQIVTRKVV